MMAKEKQAFRQFLVGSGPTKLESYDLSWGIGDEIFEVWKAKVEYSRQAGCRERVKSRKDS